MRYLSHISEKSAISVFFCLFLGQVLVFGQQAEGQVKLVDWSAADCDQKMFASHLITRITDVTQEDSITLITVGFSDNCCSEFSPNAEFKNGDELHLSYQNTSDAYCNCDCCFSIQFYLSGLQGKHYDVYFKGKEVVLSEYHYKTLTPTFEIFEGRQINRKNLYGFQEGTWITFYEDSSIESIDQYPEKNSFNPYESPVYIKTFHDNGVLTFFWREDSSESWFEDGTLKYQHLEYKKVDTTFEYVYSLHENKKLAKRSLEMTYPFTYTSEFNPDYRSEWKKAEVIYSEEYFEDGSQEYLYGKDTSYTWNEHGIITEKKYENGKMAFDKDGKLTQHVFEWKGPGEGRDLPRSLYIFFSLTGKISSIKFVRDNARSSATFFYWKWDEAMNLVEMPEYWDGPLPWKKFPEIHAPAIPGKTD